MNTSVFFHYINHETSEEQKKYEQENWVFFLIGATQNTRVIPETGAVVLKRVNEQVIVLVIQH